MTVKLFYRRYPLYQFVLPATLIILAVTAYPLIYSWRLSFLQWNLTRPWYPRRFVGLANYIDILTSSSFWSAMKITFEFTAAAIILEFIIGLLLALLLSKSFRGSNVYRSLFLIPMMLTPVVVGLIWKFMLNQTFGVINLVLRDYFHIFGLTWHGARSTALPTIVMIDVWKWTSFMFVILLAGISAIPTDIYEQAELDGANRFSQFFYITLPLLKPIAVVAIFLRMFDSFRIFDTVWILTQGGPGDATKTISILIFRQAFRFFNLGYSSALSLLFLFFIIAVTLVMVKLSKFEI